MEGGGEVVSMALCFFLGRASSDRGFLAMGRVDSIVRDETAEVPRTGGPEMGVLTLVDDVDSTLVGVLAVRLS